MATHTNNANMQLSNSSAAAIRHVQSIIPALSTGLHKGQAGCIGVVGGCAEYTGAPFYAALSSLKAGADLAHVFCTKDAAMPIKAYSPELIVHPYLIEGMDKENPAVMEEMEQACNKVEAWLPRMSTLVIGPGLGRDDLVLSIVGAVLAKARQQNIPMVIDADGLFLITREPALITGYARATLTPNVAELARLYTAVVGKKLDLANGAVMSPEEREAAALEVSQKMAVTVLCKGPRDFITNGQWNYQWGEDGSPRRCGGQGDILSGLAGTFTNWATINYAKCDEKNIRRGCQCQCDRRTRGMHVG